MAKAMIRQKTKSRKKKNGNKKGTAKRKSSK